MDPVPEPVTEEQPEPVANAQEEGGVDGATSEAPTVVAEEGVGEPVIELPDEPVTLEMVPQAPVEVAPGIPFGVLAGGAVLMLLLVVAIVVSRPRGLPALEDSEGPPVEAPSGLVDRLRARLGRTRDALQGRFDTIFGRGKVDEKALEELEEALLVADVGVNTASGIVERLRRRLRSGETEPAALREELRASMREILGGSSSALVPAPTRPWVILVVGVNGSGKTTTIGKLATRFHREGKKVLLAAADTYRAAATEQLQRWAERAEVDIVAHGEGADPGAVAYEAIETAMSRGHDIVIVDTAGRLQTQRPLMEQLGKVRRVIGRKLEGAPHETLIVIDGTMGQNALSQARSFHEATPVTGVVVTKLDGTAKGGMVLTIAAEMGLPIKLIGIGEGMDDLRPFEAEAFVEAIA